MGRSQVHGGGPVDTGCAQQVGCSRRGVECRTGILDRDRTAKGTRHCGAWVEAIESCIWTVWWVKFGKEYWYQNLQCLVEELDWLLKAIGSSCEGKWSQQGRTLSTVVPRHSFFWFFTVMGIWCKILDTWVCPCAGKCVEQIPGSGLPGQWAARTWHLPDWLLTLHCPKSAPTVIPSISVSGCWDQELRVILDSIFVPCFAFNLSGNPMALPSIYIRELPLCYYYSKHHCHSSVIQLVFLLPLLSFYN